MSEEVKWAREIIQDGAVCPLMHPPEQSHGAGITVLQGKGMENQPPAIHALPASPLLPALAEIMQ